MQILSWRMDLLNTNIFELQIFVFLKKKILQVQTKIVTLLFCWPLKFFVLKRQISFFVRKVIFSLIKC